MWKSFFSAERINNIKLNQAWWCNRRSHPILASLAGPTVDNGALKPRCLCSGP